MLDWFANLSPNNATALASVAGNFVVALLAILGFWLTHKTSTAANKKIAEITNAAKSDELRRLSKFKLADYRIQWMEALRQDAAHLYKVQYETSVLKKTRAGDRTQEQRQRLSLLNYEASELKARILMRIKQNSDKTEESDLESALRRSVSSDGDKAQEQRQRMRELIRAILKSEWNRIKAEVEN